MDQLDSLEGWVAVKNNPFVDDLLPPRLTFLVAWNEVESKIAVTCRSSSRTVSDVSDEKTRFGYFSYQELKGIHEMLCLIHPSLSSQLPTLPEQPVGLMAYISSVPVPNDVDYLCEQLTSYFQLALDICKEKLLISTLFEEPNFDDYFENIGELRRQGYKEQIQKTEDEIDNVLFERENCVTMSEMETVYLHEDEAVFHFNVALAEYSNYQIQPFLDLREVAFNKLKYSKDNLMNPNLGERVRRENAEAISEWHGHYEQALNSIQETYINYYSQTSQIYTDMCRRMTEDKLRFGKGAFDLVGAERLFRIEENMCLENLQLYLNSKKLCVQERDKVKQEIASLDEKPGVRKEMELLENHVYRWQIRIYEEHLKILGEEERLSKTLLRARLHQIEEENDEVTFYDAVESMEEMEAEDEEDNYLDDKTDIQILKLKRKLADINRRRALLRNKKLNLEMQSKQKFQDKKEIIERFSQHHSIQIKKDKEKEHFEINKEFIVEARKKTIDRLKNHKVKYPTPATIKPLRYQPPSQRRDSLTSLSRRNPSSMANNQQRNKYQPLAPVKEKKSPVPRKPFVRPQKKKFDKVDGDVTFYISGGTVINHKIENGEKGVGELPTGQSADIHQTPLNIPPPPPPPVAPPPPPVAPPPPPVAPPPPPPQNAPPLSNLPKPPTIGLSNLSDAMLNLKKPTATMKTNNDGDGGLDLSSIASGRIKLKPASERTLKPAKQAINEMGEIFNMIKKGVKLRPLSQSETNTGHLYFPSDSHMNLLQESMKRINTMVRGNSPESADEDNSEDNGDFDD